MYVCELLKYSVHMRSLRFICSMASVWPVCSTLGPKQSDRHRCSDAPGDAGHGIRHAGGVESKATGTPVRPYWSSLCHRNRAVSPDSQAPTCSCERLRRVVSSLRTRPVPCGRMHACFFHLFHGLRLKFQEKINGTNNSHTSPWSNVEYDPLQIMICPELPGLE